MRARRITGIGRGRRRREALTNPRELFAAEAVEDAFGADDAAEGDLAGGAGADVADQGGRAAGRSAGEDLEGAVGLGGGEEADEAALVGDVERFEAEDFAGAADEFGDGHGGFVDGQGELGGLGDFHEGGGETAAGEIAQAVELEAGGEEGLHGGNERGAVALDGAFEGEVRACRHNGHTVTAEVAAEEDRIAGANGSGRDREGVLNEPNARGGDVESVALAAFDDLGVAGDDGDAGGGRGLAHGGDDALEGFGGQTLFENEGGAEPERAGAAHAEIVDGAVDGELADVAAGEEERADDVGIGGECEAGAGGGEDGAVVLGIEGRVREGGAEDAVDQVLGEGAAAAVADRDFGAVGERDRAGGEDGGGRRGVGHALKLGAARGSAEEKSREAVGGVASQFRARESPAANA